MIALIIVLGHMVVPHHHHSDSVEHYCDSKQEAHILDAIARFFHPDLGEEHLEEWTDKGSTNLVFFLRSSEFSLEQVRNSPGILVRQSAGTAQSSKIGFRHRGPPVKV